VSAIFGSEDTETETDSLVDDLFKERVASATSTGSADESLAARIAAGEFSSTSPLVEFFKPLRKALAQVPGPGAWATQGGSRSGEGLNPHKPEAFSRSATCKPTVALAHAPRPCYPKTGHTQLATRPRLWEKSAPCG